MTGHRTNIARVSYGLRMTSVLLVSARWFLCGGSLLPRGLSLWNSRLFALPLSLTFARLSFSFWRHFIEEILRCDISLKKRGKMLYTRVTGVYIVQPMPGRCADTPADTRPMTRRCRLHIWCTPVQVGRTSAGYFPTCEETSAGYRHLSG